jgi:hypothetical protein
VRLIPELLFAPSVQIIRSDRLVPSTLFRQIRRPRTKRRRIQKKWRKVRSNWGVAALPPAAVFINPHLVCVNKAMWEQIQQLAAKA